MDEAEQVAPVEDTPPGTPTSDPAVEARADDTPEPPCKWFRVEFVARAGTRTPVEAAGRWWFGRSVHILPESCAREVAAQPDFTLLNEVPMPANAKPCTGCGKTKPA